MLKYSSEFLENFWDSVSNVMNSIWKSDNNITNFQSIEESTILNLIKDRSFRVVDLGCGFGRILKVLKNAGFEKLYGLDISRRVLKNCRGKLTNCILLNCDIRKRLPFEDNFFDFTIIAGNTLTSSGLENPEKILKEVFRILRKGGKTIIGEYNAEFLEEFVDKYYKKFPKEFKFKRFDKKTNTVYVGKVFSHWTTENELKNLIEKAGFKLVSIQKKGVGLIAIGKKV